MPFFEEFKTIFGGTYTYAFLLKELEMTGNSWCFVFERV